MQVGHPVLRRQADAVDPAWLKTSEAQSLIEQMVETMRKAPGIGLAAPQIGQSIQLAVLEHRVTPEEEEEDDGWEVTNLPLTILVNPTIKRFGGPSERLYEGCLSFEGFSAVTPRHRRVRVQALDQHGEPQTLEMSGYSARIFQHECDHLVGTLYVDRMEPTTLTENRYLLEGFEA